MNRCAGWPATRRLALALAFGLGATLLAACATPPAMKPDQKHWSGRLAMQVASIPPQSVSAGFELSGSPDAGELWLTSPLGNTVASVTWSPGLAELRQGEQVVRRASLDALTTELGGAPLPVLALFAWLNGQPQNANGWTADLSRHPEGRITARRSDPAPSAELRIVFQP